MSDKILPCKCGYEGELAGMNNGAYLVLSCPKCNAEATAFTLPGLVEAWNKKAIQSEGGGE